MAGLKVLGLLLIFGCLAVSAQVKEQNKSDEVPRAVSEQDVRLFWNPLISHVLAAKPSRQPPKRDPPHHHHHYPYPYYYYHYPHTPPTTTTPMPTTTSTTPKPTTVVPENGTQFFQPGPFYNPYIPSNGFYQQYPGQPPVIVIVSPTNPPSATGAGTGGNNAGAGTGSNNAGAGTGGNNAGAGTGGNNAGAGTGARYTLYPGTQSEYVEEEPQYDYVDMSARNVKDDAVSIVASDSDEDKEKDTFIVDTKDIKLPFGITINSSSGSSSDKKNKEQEALIYLRNYKRGRQLSDEQSA